MNIAFLIGRIIFGGYWLMASFNHFKNLNYLSEYAKARGTPASKVAVAGTGIILLFGGLSMLLGCLSRKRDCSADHLPAGRVVPDAYLLEGRRCSDEADRHDQFHEEHGTRRSTLDVPAAAATVADGSRDRVASKPPRAAGRMVSRFSTRRR